MYVSQLTVLGEHRGRNPDDALQYNKAQPQCVSRGFVSGLYSRGWGRSSRHGRLWI